MGYFSCSAESAISTSSSQLPQKPINRIQQFQYSDLEAATNGFSEQKLLGKGSHGCVYKAVLRGRLVAVKKPSRGSGAGPRLVNLVGFTNDSKQRLLVVEFMSNGTLYDVLHSNSRTPIGAIDTLHSSVPPVIHRDIKSANVLIDRNFNARLGDFGLALRCHVDDYRLRSTPPAGTMGYLDPCYVTPDNLSTKTDVFSFGILLLEIISGRKAIDVGHSPPSIVDWAIPLIRKGKLLAIYDPTIAPPKEPFVRKQLAVIAAKCVRSCRERRPSMKEVVEWLGGLSKLVPLHTWNGFNNPCLMVETMGRPVEASKMDGVEGGNMDGMDAKFGRTPLRNSRRVYSDLGFRNNLMDLMAGTDGESEFRGEAEGFGSMSKSVNWGSSFRFDRGVSLSLKAKPFCRRGSEIFSRRDQSSFSASKASHI
ncbi:hypothetical protein AAG906_021865 [Vitis piasezkii]